MLKNKTLLIIGMVWPEPKSSAAGTRMLQLIALFNEQGYNIVFGCAAQKSDFSFDLAEIGVRKKEIKLNSSSFDDFVKELQPEIVLFDRYIMEEQFGWRVQENSPDSIKILDTEDLHCLRLERQMAINKGIEFKLTDLLTSDYAKREIASIYRCDLSLIISSFEVGVLKDIFKIDENLLHYLPLFYDLNLKTQKIDFTSKKDFVFIGNFLHEPNWDAVKQLKETIWPRIKARIPLAKMNIYGAYASQKVLQLNNLNENFIIHGRAENAEKAIGEARILLAPIRFGAGLKGKLLEAMTVGTPSITTNVGAEGISKVWNGFIEDNDSDFVEKAIFLYENENIWNEAVRNGFEIIGNMYKKSLFNDLFKVKINQTLDNKTAFRKNNFIGAMLSQNRNLSTKYLSKWIEEKNK